MLSVLKQFRPKQAVEVPITSPIDGKSATGLVFVLCGRYTEEFDRAAEAARAGIKDGDTQDDRIKRLVAHCVIRWEGAFDDDGNAVACTPDKVLSVFEAYEWVYEQMRLAFLDQTRFFEPAKTS